MQRYWGLILWTALALASPARADGISGTYVAGSEDSATPAATKPLSPPSRATRRTVLPTTKFSSGQLPVGGLDHLKQKKRRAQVARSHD